MRVEAKELTKNFYDPVRGEFAAVDRATFCCEPGQIFGLLGPNGAGKTTTLRLISTILKPTSGTATIAGFDLVKQAQEVRRRLGFLSSDTQLYERLTPREIMMYFGRISGVSDEKLKKQIEKLVELLDMRSFIDVRCSKLSTGMKQKASIARTIVHDPEVVILDEPTTGLDVLAIQAMHDFVRECKNQEKCVIFSTHTMSEAEKLCDVIGIIHNGKLMALGSLDELRTETGKETMEEIFLSVVQRENT